MDRIHIFLASDDNYAQHAAVVITSIICNHKTPSPITIHYLNGGLSLKNKELIKTLTATANTSEIIFHDMKDSFKDLFISRHISHAAYYRLKIAQLVPDSVTKAIYLDTDLLVLHDIEELWNINISDYSIGAVADLGLRRKLDKTKERLSIPKNANYFNSGVLLLNLARWRSNKISAKIIDYLGRHPNLPYHDQDALNAVLWEDSVLIDPKWNVYKGIFHYYYKKNRTEWLPPEFIQAARNPSIVHFTGPVKPWHYACALPYSDKYYFYLSKTPWADYRPNDKNLKSFSKRWEWKIKRILFS